MSAQENILFSIIIPTYNSEQTLNRCLESIITQTYKDFEVWIIDNHSTDQTINIIRQYQSSHTAINYISEKDKGIYDAMNRGIDLADGSWLYFMGSDDSFYNENVLAAVAAKINSANAQIIYGNVIMRGQNQWGLDNVVFDGEYDLKKFIDRNICHQAMFYEKAVFKLNGYFDLKYITGSDFDFNLRCYSNTAFTYLDLIMANFFVGGQSTHVEDHQFKKDRGALLYKYFGHRIFSVPFLNARLYIRQAALSLNSPLHFGDRAYCLLVYIKLKIHSLFIST
jgi:glycosyltransferase involved in cell wall biosynthesis